MTSGSFHSIELSTITVDRAGRQRRELLNLDVLSDSVRRLGLIHPIVITRDLVLVAGERRYEACKALGWTHITCQFTDELDQAALRSLELEENIKRQDISWQDRCRAVQEYHSLRAATEPPWTQGDTAQALGESRPGIVAQLQVAKELAAGNERVLAAPKYSVARGIVQRSESRKDAAAMETLAAVLKIAPDEAPPESILNEDFLKWVDTYIGPKFNFLHCDLPYGIGADTFNQGSASARGGYDDSEEHYWNLCEGVAFALDRHCTESCHVMFWFSMKYYQRTLDFFAERDLDFNHLPLIWMKSDNVGILPDPQRGPRQIYETAFFGSRGDRKIVRSKANAYHSPSVRDEHMSIKPEPVLRHFFEMFVDENTIMLDPTCGSGSSLRAAESLNARHVTGLELNPEFVERARLALTASQQRKVT